MIEPVQMDLYAVIGRPVKHSLSPAMMNAVFRSLGIPGVYVALQVDAFPEDMEVLHRSGFRGVSVTLPYKEDACRLAVSVDDTARAIGAVNTLRRCAAGWEGINTDWVGACRALRQAMRLDGRRFLVIGAGGVARAVTYGLKQEGAAVTIANRSIERGSALARQFNCDFLPLADLTASPVPYSHKFDGIVQCTSVGLRGTSEEKEGAKDEPCAIVPSSLFHYDMVVMDTVYRPLWTPFLVEARKAGCKVVVGLEMLLHQGVAQLEWWLGRPIPVEGGTQVMREALTKVVAHG